MSISAGLYIFSTFIPLLIKGFSFLNTSAMGSNPHRMLAYTIISLLMGVNYFIQGHGEDYFLSLQLNTGNTPIFWCLLIHFIGISIAIKGYLSTSVRQENLLLFLPIAIFSVLFDQLNILIVLNIVSILIWGVNIDNKSERTNYRTIIPISLYLVSYVLLSPQWNADFSISLLLGAISLQLGLVPFSSLLTHGAKEHYREINHSGLSLIPPLSLTLLLMSKYTISDSILFVCLYIGMLGSVLSPLISIAQSNAYKIIFYIRHTLISLGILAMAIGRLDVAASLWIFAILHSHIILNVVSFISNRTGPKGEEDVKNMAGLRDHYGTFYIVGIGLFFPLLCLPGSSGLFLIYELFLVLGRSSVMPRELTIVMVFSLFALCISAYRFIWHAMLSNEKQAKPVKLGHEKIVKTFWMTQLILSLIYVLAFIPDIFSSTFSSLHMYFIGKDFNVSVSDMGYSFQKKNIILMGVVLISILAASLSYVVYLQRFRDQYFEKLKFRFYGLWFTFHDELRSIGGFPLWGKRPKKVIDKPEREVTGSILVYGEYIVEGFVALSKSLYEIRPKGINSNLLYMSMALLISLIIFLVSI